MVEEVGLTFHGLRGEIAAFRTAGLRLSADASAEMFLLLLREQARGRSSAYVLIPGSYIDYVLQC